MRYPIPLLLSLPLLSGCGDPACPPAFLWSGESCDFDEDALSTLVATLEEGVLVKVNSEPYLPPWSSKPFRRNAWVSPVEIEDEDLTAADLYKSIDQDDWSSPLELELPVGTVVVHEAVDREEPHGVAVKRADYTNDMGGPWWFQMVFEDGTFDTAQPYQPCMDCHTDGWRPTEGLWGVPTFAK